MGGNAFKQQGYESQRMSQEVFDTVRLRVCKFLDSMNDTYSTMQSVREKTEHGDLDILVIGRQGLFDEIIKKRSELNCEIYFRNGGLLSLLVDGLYQVDFIMTKKQYIDYNVQYLSWNDLGNLLGRLIKRSGYRHGHDGLAYIFRYGDHFKEVINLSYDYQEILKLLELDIEKYNNGFNTYEEMFEWLYASPYFNSDCFKLENLNNRNRVRDRKRKVYNLFIEWLSKKPYKDGGYTIHPFERFEGLREKHDWLLKKCEYKSELANKFSGFVVMEYIDNIRGRELGHFIAKFKNKYPPEQIYSMTKEEIKEAILKLNQEQ